MGAAAEHFHPARRRLARTDRGERLLQRHATAEQYTERRRQVPGVERADEPGTEFAGAPAASRCAPALSRAPGIPERRSSRFAAR
jgi:hypothetical protein